MFNTLIIYKWKVIDLGQKLLRQPNMTQTRSSLIDQSI